MRTIITLGIVLDMTLSGRTGEDGVAELQLAPGRYTFSAQAPGSPGASVVAAASGEEVVIRLPAGGSLTVDVKDADDEPVAGATVTFYDESGRVADRPQFTKMLDEAAKPKAPFKEILIR